MEDRTDQVVVAAFMNGLLPGTIYEKFIEAGPTTVSKLILLVKTLALTEETGRKKWAGHKKEDKPKRNQQDTSGKAGVFDRLNFNKGCQEPRMSDKSLTPLTKTRTEILSIYRDVHRNPLALMSPAHRRNRELYCAYHNDHGHDTESCNDLKKKIEDCLKNGMLRQYIANAARSRGQRWALRPQNRGGQYQEQRANQPYQPHYGQQSSYRGNLPSTATTVFTTAGA